MSSAPLKPSAPIVLKSTKPIIDLTPLDEMTDAHRKEYQETQHKTWTRHQLREAFKAEHINSKYLYHETSAIREVRAGGLQPTQPKWKEKPKGKNKHRWDARGDGYLCMGTSEGKAKSLGDETVMLRMSATNAETYDFRWLVKGKSELRTTHTIPVQALEYYDKTQSKWKPLSEFKESTAVETKSREAVGSSSLNSE